MQRDRYKNEKNLYSESEVEKLKDRKSAKNKYNCQQDQEKKASNEQVRLVMTKIDGIIDTDIKNHTNTKNGCQRQQGIGKDRKKNKEND